ncbi:hypothetical protein BCR35DRAFT_130832 [Leucosporidium creatinivorum]|uniref:Uncharacterized protein n=1 Tax=Leucosporidium creatinivorum TaxID=106004 RepID=A0A1Y2EV64_9BASI|nr:hypothetical protein BCR35DRAFT_130832 [Leucosporidium creatinivorum]
MPLRTSPIPHSSGSYYNQATPSLIRDDGRWPHQDSSSSPGTTLATPTDAAKYNLNGRGRAPKEGHRRSVRVRTASGGRTSSSPQVLLPDPPSSTTDYPTLVDPPTRPRPSRTASSTSNTNSTSASSAAQRARVPPSARGGVATQSSHAQTLALAQAHGITADQFEEAKQQVMRFLRTDAAAAAAEIPSSPSAQEKGKGKQILGRSVSSGSGGYSSGAASMSNVGSASAHLGSLLEQELSSRSLRARASAESLSHRNDEQSRKEQQLRRWAQEESSSSEEEGSTAAPPFSFSASSRHPSIPPSSAATTLLPSPSFGSDPQSSGLAPSPGTLKASLAKRGMMERFMSDRASPQKQDDDEEPIASTSTLAQAPPQIRTVFSPGPSPRQASKREHTASPPRRSAGSSPPRRSAGSSPNPIMTSPAPSRGSGPGVLFSPT